MSFKDYVITEDIKRLGKIKLGKPRDALSSFRFQQTRGMNRKNLRMVPASHAAGEPSAYTKGLPQFIRGLDLSNKVVDQAKKAPSGVWRISKQQVLDIAKKYKFHVPGENKPMKHLGSTGIQIIRYKPGIYYLYKPRRAKRRRKTRHASLKAGSLMKGI